MSRHHLGTRWHYSRSFDNSQRLKRCESLRQLILRELNKLDRTEVVTAWGVAKAINALGSSVSSLMFKMRNAGLIEESGARTKQHGRFYRSVNLEAYQ